MISLGRHLRECFNDFDCFSSRVFFVKCGSFLIVLVKTSTESLSSSLVSFLWTWLSSSSNYGEYVRVFFFNQNNLFMHDFSSLCSRHFYLTRLRGPFDDNLVQNWFLRFLFRLLYNMFIFFWKLLWFCFQIFGGWSFFLRCLLYWLIRNLTFWSKFRFCCFLRRNSLP